MASYLREAEKHQAQLETRGEEVSPKRPDVKVLPENDPDIAQGPHPCKIDWGSSPGGKLCATKQETLLKDR